MMLPNLMILTSRSFWEFLRDLKSASWEILQKIFNHNFDFLYEEFWGWSVLDLLSIAFAFWMLRELFSWFIRLLTTALNDLTHNGLSQVVNVALILGRRVVLRAWYTALYLWNLNIVQYHRTRITLAIKAKLINIFIQAKKRLSW